MFLIFTSGNPGGNETKYSGKKLILSNHVRYCDLVKAEVSELKLLNTSFIL